MASREPTWRPCRKKPIVVHVRDAVPGEEVFTREGLTLAKPDDLVMRGIDGEVYPIGRDVFERTYDLVAIDPARKTSVAVTGEQGPSEHSSATSAGPAMEPGKSVQAEERVGCGDGVSVVGVESVVCHPASPVAAAVLGERDQLVRALRCAVAVASAYVQPGDDCEEDLIELRKTVRRFAHVPVHAACAETGETGVEIAENPSISAQTASEPRARVPPQSPEVLGEREREMMLHATGGKRDVDGRNHYCVGQYSDEAQIWRRLKARGLAEEGALINDGRDAVFRVTVAGCDALYPATRIPPQSEPAGPPRDICGAMDGERRCWLQPGHVGEHSDFDGSRVPTHTWPAEPLHWTKAKADCTECGAKRGESHYAACPWVAAPVSEPTEDRSEPPHDYAVNHNSGAQWPELVRCVDGVPVDGLPFTCTSREQAVAACWAHRDRIAAPLRARLAAAEETVDALNLTIRANRTAYNEGHAIELATALSERDESESALATARADIEKLLEVLEFSPKQERAEFLAEFRKRYPTTPIEPKDPSP